jgi:hypothetical protein
MVKADYERAGAVSVSGQSQLKLGSLRGELGVLGGGAAPARPLYAPAGWGGDEAGGGL